MSDMGVINGSGGSYFDVCFTPNIRHSFDSSPLPFRAKKRHRANLFNHLVGHCKNLCRQIEAKRFRSLKIDHEHELGCLHHR